MATIVFMVIAVLWAPQISKSESFMDYMQGVLALISPPVVAVFLAGLFSKRITSNGAFAGLITGFIMGVGFVILQITGQQWAIDIPFLLKAPLIFFTCFSVTWLVSLLGKPKSDKELEGLVYTLNLYKEETLEMKGLSWYNNYRILSVLLLLITFVVVYIFR
jgi:SSS family solute:Na+ symporter